jgi:hypothetical protein
MMTMQFPFERFQNISLLLAARDVKLSGEKSTSSLQMPPKRDIRDVRG